MNLSYTIDPNNFAVKIFVSGQELPIVYQPDWPNATPWSSATEAELWAQLCIQSIVDADAPYAPLGPGLQGEPKNIPQPQ
jgi:hypothetical protein